VQRSAPVLVQTALKKILAGEGQRVQTLAPTQQGCHIDRCF
jgi:hypothetical protein